MWHRDTVKLNTNSIGKMAPVDLLYRVATNFQFVKAQFLWSAVKWSTVKQCMPVLYLTAWVKRY